ncbi:MAG TPA: LysR substrate-binding domain-containing protein [Sphingomicrobium sp.]|nr:LysR substrate-binding domain-containing protein [Sphingomicrobium sp.]
MSPKLPPLESLRFLEACVRYQNMTKAAYELGVTPAAVSLRIRNLESELGMDLFVRSGPRIVPTDAGKALAIGIRGALADLQDAVTTCRASTLRIRVTAVPTLAARWLAGALTRYHAENPTSSVVVDATEDLRPAGSFDIAVRHGKGNWPGLSADRIFAGEATPMVGPSLAAQVRSPADLAQLPLVPDARWKGWFAALGTPVENLSFTVDYPSQELAAAAVGAGGGVALLSPILFAPLIAEGKLVRPFAATSPGDSYFIAIAENESRGRVLELRDFLVSHARTSASEEVT